MTLPTNEAQAILTRLKKVETENSIFAKLERKSQPGSFGLMTPKRKGRILTPAL
jgi:hypothetical protein